MSDVRCTMHMLAIKRYKNTRKTTRKTMKLIELEHNTPWDIMYNII